MLSLCDYLRLPSHVLSLTSACRKTVDDIVYEVDCALMIVKEGDVDIGNVHLI